MAGIHGYELSIENIVYSLLFILQEIAVHETAPLGCVTVKIDVECDP